MNTPTRQARAELEERVLGAYVVRPHAVWRAAGPAWGLELFRERRGMAAAVFEHAPDLDAITEALRRAGSTDTAPGIVLEVPDADVAALVDLHTKDLDEKKEKSEGGTLGARWRSFTVEQLAAPPPPKLWIWQDRIGLGDTGTVVAPGGTGKTAMTVGLAIHRAMGRPFLGKWVRQGTTVIVSGEDRTDDYLRKLAAWRDWLRDMDLEAVARHVHLIDVGGLPFRLIRSQFGEYLTTENVQLLADIIRDRAPDADLIIAETVSRFGGDEGNPAMSAIVSAGEELATAARGASVALVAHTGKAAARANTGDAYAARGGSAISDNGRWCLTLAGADEERLADLLPGVPLPPERLRDLAVFRAPKVNGAPPQDPVVLQRVGTSWGLVLRPFDSGAASSPEEARRFAQEATGARLRELARRLGELGEYLTESKLTGGLFKDAGIPKHRIQSAVMEAIEAGYLQRGPKGRGGGNGCLLPGPTLPAGMSPGEFAGELAGDFTPSTEQLTHPPKAKGLGEFDSPQPVLPCLAGPGDKLWESSLGEFGGVGVA